MQVLGDAFAGVLTCLDELTELVPNDLLSCLHRADILYLREEIPKAIAQSLDGIKRIANIVGAMKEFSHPAQERTPTDINRAFANTITVATNEWKYVATIATDFDPALPAVPVIPGEFNQVILNISRELLHEFHRRGAMLDAVERHHPGLLRLELDDSGAIVVDDLDPNEPAGDLLKEIEESMDQARLRGVRSPQGLRLSICNACVPPLPAMV